MALLNIFKGKERPQQKGRKSQEETAKPEQKAQFQEAPAPEKVRTGGVRPAHILRVPHVTEKAVNLADQNQYVFEVYPEATKGAVKEAVEQVYGVAVVGVRMVSIPPKRVRMRRRRGQGVKQGLRKAIVEVQKGQKIEILPV